MFSASRTEAGDIRLEGRLDAAQAETARSFFQQIEGSCTVDFKDLDYISSAGLGVLVMTQKRLKSAGAGLKLVNMNGHIKDIFHYAGFDKIFELG